MYFDLGTFFIMNVLPAKIYTRVRMQPDCQVELADVHRNITGEKQCANWGCSFLGVCSRALGNASPKVMLDLSNPPYGLQEILRINHGKYTNGGITPIKYSPHCIDALAIAGILSNKCLGYPKDPFPGVNLSHQRYPWQDRKDIE